MAVTTERVLVTGGCGFIGVNLGDHLSRSGYQAVAYDDMSQGDPSQALEAGYSEVITGDVLNPDALRDAMRGADRVVHLAAQTGVMPSIEDPITDFETNARGTLNVLMAARDLEIAGVVLASSNAPLGSTAPPAREDVAARPLSPYGASKLTTEAYASAFAGSFDTPVTVLRFSNVYGPRSFRKGSVVAKLMREILAGHPITIYGDGLQTRDFIYVADLSDGIIRAMESGLRGEVIQLGTGVETTITALVDIMIRLFPDCEIAVRNEPPRAGEVARSFSDITKARRLLGFTPVTSLPDGLRDTRDWFLDAVGVRT